MCTASNYITENHYFGRNFDYEISYKERVTITPRNYEFKFRKIDDIKSHYAMIGIAAGIDAYPLYYDACNEKGLAIAGLNFAGNAVYREFEEDMVNITPFELIPYLLGKASNLDEARELLSEINLVNINFAEELPLSPLHWMISDNTGESIIVEPLEDGLKIYDNPVGVLTNNPPFDKQLFTALLLAWSLPAPFIIPLFADLGEDGEYVSTALSMETVASIVLFIGIAVYALA